MKNLAGKVWIGILSALLFFPVAPARGQTPAGGLAPLDESQFSDTPAHASQQPSARNPAQKQDLGPEPDMGGEPEGEGGIKTAVIEGVQISSEPGDKPDEKVVSCYFIFREKPSSYFYDVKVKEKKIIFEFNDTKASAAPVPSVAEAPIKGFAVEQHEVDANKDVKGQKPEYHSLIRVVFNVDAVPKITVNDEYNVISFNYKWSTDPAKMKDYILTPTGITPYLLVGGGTAVLGGGALWYFVLRKPRPVPTQAIDISDLPVHQN